MYPNEESRLVRELWTSLKTSSDQPKNIAEGFFNIYFLNNYQKLQNFNVIFQQQLDSLRVKFRDPKKSGNIKLQKEKKNRKN
jgi:hypothetical protein